MALSTQDVINLLRQGSDTSEQSLNAGYGLRADTALIVQNQQVIMLALELIIRRTWRIDDTPVLLYDD